MEIKQRIIGLLKRAEFNRAIVYGFTQRVFDVLSGPITVVLIAKYFSPDLQGYYYTFASILALQSYVDMGLGNAVLQFASHEWAHLGFAEDGSIHGDQTALSRLVSLSKISLTWYFVFGWILTIALAIGGYILFSKSPTTGIYWLWPWFLMCVLTGINFNTIPLWSILEGCNQVHHVYLFRLYQSFSIRLTVWIAIIAGAQLWVAVLSSLVNLVCVVFLVRKKYWKFMRALLSFDTITAKISWWKEIWPYQWRIGLGGLSSYFTTAFFAPVLFSYHGPVVAGQMGMTWNMVYMTSNLSALWTSTRIPQFGILIAQKKYKELDKLIIKLFKVVLPLTLLAGAGLWGTFYFIRQFGFKLGYRVLDPLPFGLLVIAQTLLALTIPLSSYLRAHKKEPLMPISVGSSLATGVSTLILGKYYSVTGITAGYLAIVAIAFPVIILIWKQKRHEWHTAPAGVINYKRDGVMNE